jgi:hypothetical protein
LYRSKLAGISGSLAIIYAVCQQHAIQEGLVTLILDGIETTRRASNTYQPLSPQETDFDLLLDIRAKVTKLPITINWKWIEGHQDNYVSFSKLSPLSQDNVWVDRLAKACMKKCLSIDYECPPQRFGNEGWSLSFQGYKLSKVDFNRLYAKMWSEKGITYWSRKHKISEQQARTIDWDMCGRAINSLNSQERRRIVKHATGHFGNHKKLHQWKLQDHAECPLCGAEESAEHIIKCSDPQAHTVWDTSILKLSAWLTKKRTQPQLQQAILSRLVRSWHNSTPTKPFQFDNDDITSAALNQEGIGWYPFLLGHLSHYWQAIQHNYFVSLGLRNTGAKWTAQLIIKLFNTSWGMWEHRNCIKHKTLTAAKLRVIRDLDSSISTEYSQGRSCLLPKDKQWLKKPLQTILDTYSVVKKKQWLASIAVARLKWTNRCKTARASQDASRRLLSRWLRSSNPTTTPSVNPNILTTNYPSPPCSTAHTSQNTSVRPAPWRRHSTSH